MSARFQLIRIALISSCALLIGCGTPDTLSGDPLSASPDGQRRENAKAVSRGKAPEWVTHESATEQYPRSRYFSGFGTCSVGHDMSENDAVEYSKNMALKQMVNGMRITISAEDSSTRVSSISNGEEELVDAFRSSVVSRSDFTFDGVEFQSYVRRKEVYSLALLNKGRATTHYTGILNEQLSQLQSLYEKAIRQALAGNSASTSKSYVLCERKINEVYKTIQYLHLLGCYQTLDEDSVSLISDVQTRLSLLWRKKCNSLQEAVEQLAHAIQEQAKPKGKVHVLAPMIEDSHQYSQFSGRIRTLLESQIGEDTKLRAVVAGDGVYMPSSSRKEAAYAKSGNVDFILRGNYFVNKDSGQVKVITSLVNVRDRSVEASASAILTPQAVGGLELYPQNYLAMVRDRRVFGAGEIVRGGLNLEVWTSKGADDLLLESGEDLEIFIRVNKPCYIRFIYHLNNGARVFVDDTYKNYYIGGDKVNRPVQLPDTFTILPPFGSETMQFFASTERLPDLKEEYRSYGGESYKVVSGELAGINRINRGLGIKKNTSISSPVIEERISLTTIKR